MQMNDAVVPEQAIRQRRMKSYLTGNTEWPAHGHIGDKKRDVTLIQDKAARCVSPTSEE